MSVRVSMVDLSSSCWPFLLLLYCSTVCLPKHQINAFIRCDIKYFGRSKNSKYSPSTKIVDQRDGISNFDPKIENTENTKIHSEKKMHVRLFSDERTRIGALSIAQRRSNRYYNSRINWHLFNGKNLRWNYDNQTPHEDHTHTTLKNKKGKRSRFLDFLVWCGVINLSSLHPSFRLKRCQFILLL